MKKKEKLVKKYLPVETFDMAGLETWLSDMAAQGLYVQEINGEWAKFRPGPADSRVRYALDITGPCDIDHERNENYAQMGWNYVTTLVNMYYVYCSEDPGAPELHTDPVTQSGTLTPLIRRQWRRMIFLLILFAVLIRGTVVDLFTDPWSLVELVLVNTGPAVIYYVMVILYVISVLFFGLWTIRSLGKLRRQLAAGIPLEGGTRWRRRIPPPVLNGAIFAVYIAALAAIVFTNASSHGWNLSNSPMEGFPPYTLAETVTEEVSWQEPWSGGTVRHSFLCPEQLTVSQRGTALTGSDPVDCGVYIGYDRVRDEALAPFLLRCHMEEERTWWREYDGSEFSINPPLTLYEDFRPVSHPLFDELQIMTWQTADMDAPRSYYMGRLDDQVFVLTCWGLPDLDLCLDWLAQWLTEQA